jgi:hypothetical protein
MVIDGYQVAGNKKLFLYISKMGSKTKTPGPFGNGVVLSLGEKEWGKTM